MSFWWVGVGQSRLEKKTSIETGDGIHSSVCREILFFLLSQVKLERASERMEV